MYLAPTGYALQHCRKRCISDRSLCVLCGLKMRLQWATTGRCRSAKDDSAGCGPNCGTAFLVTGCHRMVTWGWCMGKMYLAPTDGQRVSNATRRCALRAEARIRRRSYRPLKRKKPLTPTGISESPWNNGGTRASISCDVRSAKVTHLYIL